MNAAAAESLQPCLTPCDPMHRSPPRSSVHGILQASALEWAALLSSRGNSHPRGRTQVSCTMSRFFTTEPPGKPHWINNRVNKYKSKPPAAWATMSAFVVLFSCVLGCFEGRGSISCGKYILDVKLNDWTPFSKVSYTSYFSFFLINKYLLSSS